VHSLALQTNVFFQQRICTRRNLKKCMLC